MTDAHTSGVLRSRTEPEPLLSYVAGVWRRREFTVSLATGSLRGQYLDTLLGNVWHVLTPLLSMGVYWLIFGVILGTRRGLDNFIGYLAVGIFTFGFIQRTVSACGASLTNNMGLIRSLQFPRAVLPVASAVRELASYGFATGVMVFIVLATGERPTWSWLLAPVVVVLATMFATGLGLVIARLTDSVRDVSNILPFLFRFTFYFSGVIFYLPEFVTTDVVSELGVPLSGEQVRHLFVLNPFFTYTELLRATLMGSYDAEHARDAWIAAFVIAPVTIVLGLAYFKGGEARYGRG